MALKPTSSASTVVPWCDFHGQPAVRLVASWGDCVTVLQQGGQVVSWMTADGREQLYLSPQARWNGQDAIRGGVPICFPQFNQRGPLIKHGFARHLPWQCVSVNESQISFVLADGALTRRLWPHAFRVELAVELSPGALRLQLQVQNTDTQPWAFTAALHTYVQVPDVVQVHLMGLHGAQRWDAVRDVHGIQEGAARFGQEFDCVFQSQPEQVLRLLMDGAPSDAPRSLLDITQSVSCPQTVVWNPGPRLGARLNDMPDDGWRHMLCIEAACIDAPVTLAPTQRWQAWQTLRCRA
ncbi:D-hexose-6-phosphate mutarotase [Lampropedia puyangensis]|uniref:Putative glucose-6-phosphate 1-epimerase n=1 Tax=Lampropedia puyangensis TaxID=1330072 RepID=A0A4V4GQV8_9BURK|nr:D-hexose-6-phosphate mutarotase [Lampropedia puyangensis]THT99265.1 D-hexose-6-phosphate mutarotase [Lampropedia puyangensis]